jgi:hypothetical protein
MKLEVGLNMADFENFFLYERIILKWENVKAILLRTEIHGEQLEGSNETSASI